MTDRRGLIREQRELIAVDAILVEVRRRPHPGRESDDTRLIEFNAIKNEIVVAMLKWDGNVPELARELVAMYGNVKMGGMWRNYCVQFLGQIFGKIHDPDSRAAALDVFENALGDERLLPLCRKLAGNASARVRSRMAALAALGLLGGPEDLPLLNDCRNNPDVRLRTAARGAAERLRGKR